METERRRDEDLFTGEIPEEVDHLRVLDSTVDGQDLPLFQDPAGHGQVHLHHLRNWRQREGQTGEQGRAPRNIFNRGRSGVDSPMTLKT